MVFCLQVMTVAERSVSRRLLHPLQVEEALVTWEQGSELDARSCWRELRKVADAILTMTEGEHLSVSRPTLLKSLVGT